MSKSMPASPSIACLLSGEESALALNSILTMLKPYLKHAWRVETGAVEQAAVRIINLDHPDGPALLASLESQPGGVIGTAQRPRQHPAGTIHRPFRAYEVLSLLKEAERLGITTPNATPGGGAAAAAAAKAAPAAPVAAPAAAPTTPAPVAATVAAATAAATAAAATVQTLEADQSRSFKLIFWPNEFEGWPREWWGILACLRRRRLTMADLVKELNLPPATVAQCLDQLLRINAVRVKFDMQAMAAPAPEAPAKRPWQKLGARLMGLLRGGASA